MSDHRPVAADFDINVRASLMYLHSLLTQTQIALWDIEEYVLVTHKLMREARQMEGSVGRSTLKVLNPSVDVGRLQ
jgi:hypothetical protein